jgi:hypothetical protein
VFRLSILFIAGAEASMTIRYAAGKAEEEHSVIPNDYQEQALE